MTATALPRDAVIGRETRRELEAKRREEQRKAQADKLLEQQMIRALAKEAVTYCQIMIAVWARRGASYLARSASVATDGKPVNPQRLKVQRVRIEKIRTSIERISIKIAISQRSLFGWKDMMPYGTRLSDLKCQDALDDQTAATEHLVVFDDYAFSHGKGCWFHIYRLQGVNPIPEKVLFRETLKYFLNEDLSRLPICLGVGNNRVVHMLDLTRFPHALIGGTTGGGKSNMIKNIILPLIRFISPDDLKLALIDYKVLEFEFFQGLPHLYRPVVNEPEDTMQLIDDVLKEMNYRKQTMRGHATDIVEWNAKFPDRKFPRIIIIIDEFAELSLSEDKKMRERTLLLIARLTALGRAIGIHVIGCTQRPAAEIMPMTIKANLPLVISGPVPSQHHSMTMLGTGDAAKIEKIAGRMIYKANLEIQQVQTPLVTPADRLEAIRIAKGKAAGVIILNGIDPLINPIGLIKFLLQHCKGVLALALVDKGLRDLAIDHSMMKAFVADVVKAGSVEIDDQLYKVVKWKTAHRLVAVVEVEQPPAPEPEAEPEPLSLPPGPPLLLLGPGPDPQRVAAAKDFFRAKRRAHEEAKSG